jgi:hypothetical protein
MVPDQAQTGGAPGEHLPKTRAISRVLPLLGSVGNNGPVFHSGVMIDFSSGVAKLAHAIGRNPDCSRG